VRNDASTDDQAVVDLQQRLLAAAHALSLFASTSALDFRGFERELLAQLWSLGRLVVTLFLTCRQRRLVVPGRVFRAGRVFRPSPPVTRNLNTRFGVVRYARTYLREVKDRDRHGFFPLDEALGLTHDRMSFSLLTVSARLALSLTFGETRSTLQLFVPSVPSTEVIEQTVLGLGAYTQAFFESAPAPMGDGEVLVVQIDGKGVPTATESELSRRRGKRPKRPAQCGRHRGKTKRGRYAKKPRRKKGDKSKNARMATLVVMYTLKRGEDGKLHGPLNKRVYASFAPKRHAVAVAKREALKRGFGPESGKRVQAVTDGDNDLAKYLKELLPWAVHTVDAMHVVEKLWTCGASLYEEGSEECKAWVEKQKKELYRGNAAGVVAHLKKRLEETAKSGPGNKGKRERLGESIEYLEKRYAQLKYDVLVTEDLELGSGAVEGAVKNVIGKRCDHGGMRWIKERVEAVVQLRCILTNGDWEAFEDFVYDRLRAEARGGASQPTLLTNQARPLPTFGLVD
jgi:hypothetical protein